MACNVSTYHLRGKAETQAVWIRVHLELLQHTWISSYPIQKASLIYGTVGGFEYHLQFHMPRLAHLLGQDKVGA